MCISIICLFVLAFLSSTTGNAEHSHLTLSQVPKGMTVHNVIETWENAQTRCQSEGTILASPINEMALNGMRSLIGTNAMFYTGIKATRSGEYVSVEGVALERMDVSLWQQLDPWSGDCLAFTANGLHVVPCDSRLPYMCYDTRTFNLNETYCDSGYKFDMPTRNCYKVHSELRNWHGAQMACVAEGANLLVIDDAVEADSVKNIYGPTSYIWVGLRDYSGNGDWLTVHWQRLQEVYNEWSSVPIRTEFHCAAFHLPSHLQRAHCVTGNIDFICEKKPTSQSLRNQ